ncbi:MAG TPA: hypothetical protein VF753_03075 [Terriglobales bacterium]
MLYVRRLLPLIVIVLCCSPFVAAQQYQITRADYGAGNQRIDVTQIVRQFALSNQSLRVNNTTFGSDPSPNNAKTLRIYARDSRGQQKTFEYGEGANVSTSQFSGSASGRPVVSAQYQILHAEYGTSTRHVDVTQRLRDLARTNATFRMGNSTFGVDPAPGVVKTLRIYARGTRGDNHVLEYREGSLVDGAKFSGWSGGNWGNNPWHGGWNGARPIQAGQLNIIRASYGVPGRQQDVSSRLQSLVRNGRLNIAVNNGTIGVDPAPGAKKTLWVTYSVNRGAQRIVTVQEGQTLNIP